MRILTFDIEEWFHILDNKFTRTENEWRQYESRIHRNMDRILTLLDDRNQKATFFCLGWIASKYPEVIRQIHNAGHEIASHSFSHQLVYEQDPADFREDLKLSIHALEDIIGEKIRYYRSPGFSITEKSLWAFEILHQQGIEVDCSLFPAARNHGGIKRLNVSGPVWISFKGIRLKEFPMSVHTLAGNKIPYSGGGYFRLLPYSMLRYFASRSQYVMTYFHPRDFDYGQPMVKGLGPIRKFKSYYGLKDSLEKLDLFIRDNKFITLGEAEKSIDWSKTSEIPL